MPTSKDPIKRARQFANLKPMKKGDVLNPNGRPRKTIKTFLDTAKKEGVVIPSASEVSELYVAIAAMTEEQLKKLLSDKEQPMMLRIVAKGILDKKGLDVLEKVIDRAYGKEQRLDITTNGKDIVKPEPLTIRFVASKEELAKVQGEVAPLESDASI